MKTRHLIPAALIAALVAGAAQSAAAQLIVTAPQAIDLNAPYQAPAPSGVLPGLSVIAPMAPVEAAAPAPLGEAPPIAFAPEILEMAAAYQATMGAAVRQSAVFANVAEINAAVRQGASYEQSQLQQGAVAYAAIAALQDPAFVAGLREFAPDAEARELIAARLIANPAYIESFPGADRAAGLVIAALSGQGRQAVTSGEALKRAAYSIQSQAWSRAITPRKEVTAQLEAARALALTPRAASPDEIAGLLRASRGEANLGLTSEPIPGPHSVVVTHALALAALGALDEADSARMAEIAFLLTDATSSFCLRMAKLDFQQCLAGTYQHFDDIFCLGEHAIIDTGECMVSAAGMPAVGLPAPETASNAG